MEEEFYSTIKLTTGEEIVAKVCYLANENQLLIENPKKVELIKHRRNGETIEGFILVDWIHSTYDQMYVLSMDRVITMSELDKRIERYYLATINEIDRTEDQGKIPVSKLNQKMGYLGSVNERRSIK
jgi:hypothetical protein